MRESHWTLHSTLRPFCGISHQRFPSSVVRYPSPCSAFQGSFDPPAAVAVASQSDPHRMQALQHRLVMASPPHPPSAAAAPADATTSAAAACTETGLLAPRTPTALPVSSFALTPTPTLPSQTQQQAAPSRRPPLPLLQQPPFPQSPPPPGEAAAPSTPRADAAPAKHAMPLILPHTSPRPCSPSATNALPAPWASPPPPPPTHPHLSHLTASVDGGVSPAATVAVARPKPTRTARRVALMPAGGVARGPEWPALPPGNCTAAVAAATLSRRPISGSPWNVATAPSPPPPTPTSGSGTALPTALATSLASSPCNGTKTASPPKGVLTGLPPRIPLPIDPTTPHVSSSGWGCRQTHPPRGTSVVAQQPHDPSSQRSDVWPTPPPQPPQTPPPAPPHNQQQQQPRHASSSGGAAPTGLPATFTWSSPPPPPPPQASVTLLPTPCPSLPAPVAGGGAGEAAHGLLPTPSPEALSTARPAYANTAAAPSPAGSPTHGAGSGWRGGARGTGTGSTGPSAEDRAPPVLPADLTEAQAFYLRFLWATDSFKFLRFARPFCVFGRRAPIKCDCETTMRCCGCLEAGRGALQHETERPSGAPHFA